MYRSYMNACSMNESIILNTSFVSHIEWANACLKHRHNHFIYIEHTQSMCTCTCLFEYECALTPQWILQALLSELKSQIAKRKWGHEKKNRQPSCTYTEWWQQHEWIENSLQLHAKKIIETLITRKNRATKTYTYIIQKQIESTSVASSDIRYQN